MSSLSAGLLQLLIVDRGAIGSAFPGVDNHMLFEICARRFSDWLSARKELAQRHHTERRGKWSAWITNGVGLRDQACQGLIAPGSNLDQRRPEILLQSNAG